VAASATANAMQQHAPQIKANKVSLPLKNKVIKSAQLSQRNQAQKTH
jgi:hypothetical protein